MKKSWIKQIALLLVISMMATFMLCGCGSTESEENAAVSNEPAGTVAPAEMTEEGGTIKILFKGPKTAGWDAIYEEYLARTKDTLNIELDVTFVEHADYKEKLNLVMLGGDDYDLVFDASWVHLKELAADGYYADLRAYFNNDNYPGLKAAFSETLMESNCWYGSMCYIPLAQTYGNGVPVVHYRLDWAKEWGIGTNGQINSYEELEQYWATAKENGVLPLSARNNRGFFQLFTMNGNYSGTSEAGIRNFSTGGVTYWVYIKDNKVAAIAAEGSGDENFVDFPEPFNYDFGADRYDTFAEWQKAGYLSADSMTITDEATPFYAGEAASVVGTLDETATYISNLGTYSPEGEYGYFVYIDSIRNMEDNAIPTTFSGNNGLCVPASSKNIDLTMKFLDWMFSSAENHDLFELGIEGVDWEPVGDNKMTDLSGYASSFPGYGFTWNSNYVRFNATLPDSVVEYRTWELQESSFVLQPATGFRFNTSDTELSTLVAQVKAITDTVATTKLHGVLSDGTNTYASAEEMLKANWEKAAANGALDIQAALEAQLNEFLASN